jgi:hypothetical protein
MVGLAAKDYLKNVVLRCVVVLVITLFLSSMITLVMDDSFLRLFVVCLCSTGIALLASYFIGLNNNERYYAVSVIQNYWIKIRRNAR